MNDLHGTPAVKSGGIGLENLVRRLQLLYPGAHQFETECTGETFTASLKIKMA
jgi:two-component system, LytTR family, sensor kinase